MKAPVVAVFFVCAATAATFALQCFFLYKFQVPTMSLKSKSTTASASASATKVDAPPFVIPVLKAPSPIPSLLNPASATAMRRVSTSKDMVKEAFVLSQQQRSRGMGGKQGEEHFDVR